MNDLLNSLSQMQTIEVFFWFLFVALAVVVIASMIGCIFRAWYKFAPWSLCVTLFIAGSSLVVWAAIGIIIDIFTK